MPVDGAVPLTEAVGHGRRTVGNIDSTAVIRRVFLCSEEKARR